MALVWVSLSVDLRKTNKYEHELALLYFNLLQTNTNMDRILPITGHLWWPKIKLRFPLTFLKQINRTCVRLCRALPFVRQMNTNTD